MRLLTDLYEPSAEQHWASFSSHLLLALARSTAEWERPLFTRPLSDSVQFQQYTVDTSYSVSQSGTSRAWYQPGGAGVRMTQQSQDLDFSQTQGAGNATQQRVLGAGALISSFLPDQNLAVGNAFTQMPSSQRLGTTSSPGAGMATDGSASGQPSGSVSVPRVLGGTSMRISQATLGSDARFRVQAMGRHASNAAARLRRGQAAAMGVQLYRAYRAGELPDIQIPLKDIIAPLQVLCERDSNTARAVMQLMFRSLILGNGDTDATAQGDREQLEAALRSVAIQTSGNSTFTAVLLDMLIDRADRATRPYAYALPTSSSPLAPMVADAFVVHADTIGTSATR